MSFRREAVIDSIRKLGWTPFYKASPKIPPFDNGPDEEDEVFDLWKRQVKFLKQFDRIKYNMAEDTLGEITRMVEAENESDISVRVNMFTKPAAILPTIWTRYGRILTMCILKPVKVEDFEDLRKWTLYLACDNQQDRIIKLDVARAFGQLDHIMA